MGNFVARLQLTMNKSSSQREFKEKKLSRFHFHHFMTNPRAKMKKLRTDDLLSISHCSFAVNKTILSLWKNFRWHSVFLRSFCCCCDYTRSTQQWKDDTKKCETIRRQKQHARQKLGWLWKYPRESCVYTESSLLHSIED